MNDVFARYGLRGLINCSGTETPYGAAPVCAEVIDAVGALAPHSVRMAELQSVACDVIARTLGTEAGCVTGCTAASIAVSVAAAMTGRHLGRVEQLPDTTGMKNEIVVQRGHLVTYGQSVSQNIRLSGARVVEIGAATQCGAYQLRQAITPGTAAGLYVVSFLTVQHRLIDLETFCAVCHEAGVPVIVDAASQSDPRLYVRAGADLVLFSAHKQFAGLTAGVIAGRKELVQACFYQEHGIGRPMKVGKEGVIGAIVALERWAAAGNDFDAPVVKARIRRAHERLSGLRGVAASIEGRQIKLQVSPAEAGITAYGLAQGLRTGQPAGDPAIVVWSQLADVGTLMVTFTKVADEVAGWVCDQIVDLCKNANGAHAYPPAPNIGDTIEDELARWPLPLNR